MDKIGLSIRLLLGKIMAGIISAQLKSAKFLSPCFSNNHVSFKLIWVQRCSGQSLLLSSISEGCAVGCPGRHNCTEHPCAQKCSDMAEWQTLLMVGAFSKPQIWPTVELPQEKIWTGVAISQCHWHQHLFLGSKTQQRHHDVATSCHHCPRYYCLQR